MKKTTPFFGLLLVLAFIIQACGPSQQEIEERERAVIDSLARIEAIQKENAERAALAEIEKREEEMQQAVLEEDKAERKDMAIDFIPIEFDPDGAFTIQVEAWRSEDKAEESRRLWQNRGFDQAYVVMYGDENTGDVWFRIRLGRFATHGMAQRQKNNLQTDFNILAWIDRQDKTSL